MEHFQGIGMKATVACGSALSCRVAGLSLQNGKGNGMQCNGDTRSSAVVVRLESGRMGLRPGPTDGWWRREEGKRRQRKMVKKVYEKKKKKDYKGGREEGRWGGGGWGTFFARVCGVN